MKYELNFYKSTGKWYTKNIVIAQDIKDKLIVDHPNHRDMDYTVHIVEQDGFLQPFRMYKR